MVYAKVYCDSEDIKPKPQIIICILYVSKQVSLGMFTMKVELYYDFFLIMVIKNSYADTFNVMHHNNCTMN